jgi:probable selenate reductase FAD-binding subunit
MPKKPGAYHRPESLAEALELLAQPDSVALAGGTKLLANEAGLTVDHVIDLQALGLNQIEAGRDKLKVGATCTLKSFAGALAREYPDEPLSILLQEAVKREGPNTYRNAATLGGTIASRLSDSELLAALLVVDAQLSFALSPESEEESIAAYLEADNSNKGLIASVQIPWTGGRGMAQRVARTPADYPIVSVTAWQPAGGPIRLAATGIRPLPGRLYFAEELLMEDLNEDIIKAAAQAAKENTRHPGDFRGDVAYRAQMAEVLTRRVLMSLDQ